MEEVISLVVAIICAFGYWGVIAILLWHNRKSSLAWGIAISSLILWPFLLLGGTAQLFLVLPLGTKLIIDGRDISKPLSRKAICWALGETIFLLLAGSVIGMLSDTDWKW